jgi:hypothetical protein
MTLIPVIVLTVWAAIAIAIAIPAARWLQMRSGIAPELSAPLLIVCLIALEWALCAGVTRCVDVMLRRRRERIAASNGGDAGDHQP